MHLLGLIFSLGLLGLVGYGVWQFYLDYRSEIGTPWSRAVKAAQFSATILWQKFCIVLAAIVAQLDNVADLVGQPEAKDFINTWLGNPKLIAAIMLGMAAVTIMARKRSL